MGKTTQLSTTKLVKLLQNWNTLNASLMELKEREVAWLLSYEKKHRNRLTFTLRLHARLNKLRWERERIELVRQHRNVVLLPED